MEVRIHEKFTYLSVLERKIARQLKLSVNNSSASEKGEEINAISEGENEDEYSEVG
jgi:hypothetical protein